ncbi:trypsin-like serine peptidase [Niabella hibiscisoli]|uniref:trypsin-like serine peptidase n=1 Tax=Niabella hibiscisoli TaxID=1825928 RepID=UPI001F10BD80|nr:serine protease [Niabella hibiscisoli]MCH5716673.1 serine protease [Niabella hibiscisoli]
MSKAKLPPNILSRKITTVAIDRDLLSIAKTYNICETSKRWKYDRDVQFSECTAFAISEDLVLTAGHCIDASNFRNFYFMLGFDRDPMSSITIDSSNIFEPVEFIDGIKESSRGMDFALIRVHKKIPQNKIYSCSSVKSLQSQERFYMVGHPLGTYAKISIDGILLENTNKYYFQLAIDAFGGNSGSPVLSEFEHKVKGILISGHTDLVEGKSCSEFVFCDSKTHCSGEKSLGFPVYLIARR